MIAPLTAACIGLVASSYSLPPDSLWAILKVEGGRVGECVQNTNGTQDCGPFQINSIWVPTFQKYWSLPDHGTTQAMLRDNGCWNAAAAGAILSMHYKDTKDITEAMGRYHSRTPAKASIYLGKIRKAYLSLFPNLHK